MVSSRNHIIFNIVFWLAYFMYEWLGLASLSLEFDKYFINACLALPLSFIISYMTVHVLLRRFYFKARKVEFWVIFILLSVLLLLVRRVFNYYIIYPRYFPEGKWMPLFYFPKLLIEFVNLCLITGVYTMFYFVDFWYRERQALQELKQEKITAELDLLKSQVQPHFIFNTLNNIYSAALPKDPATATLIAHLSDFLNYNLYDSKQDAVSVSSEIAYIKHYIELQKNRYGDKLDVAVNVYGSIDGLMIAPLLLLPLVENCFKHGIGNSTAESWIRMDVSADKNVVTIKIENSKEENNEPPLTVPGGIGLANVQKRLDLLYPGNHELKIIAGLHSFLVILRIKK